MSPIRTNRPGRREDRAINCTSICPPGLSLSDVQALPESVRALLRNGHADNTRRAYASDLRAYAAWGGSLPAPPAELARYIAEEGQRLAPATIQRRVTAVGTASRLLNPSSAPHRHPLVTATLRGLMRSRGTRQRRVQPLRVEQLQRILDLTSGSTRHRRDRVLLLVGFMAALRRSELVALNIEDLEFSPAGLALHVRRSKTDQASRGRVIGIPRAAGRWCPVVETRAWFTLLGETTGPLVRPVRKDGVVEERPLSAESVADTVKRWVAAIGLDPALYSGHSLRSGFVTSAMAAGSTTHLVRNQTGHTSDGMLARYDREASIFARIPAVGLL